jgi:tetratricopeptide (TPR) repeat protein
MNEDERPRLEPSHQDRLFDDRAGWSTGTASDPVDELVLELTNPHFSDREGVRRASADARLIYQPTEPNRYKVESPGTWLFQAPIGPIEADDIRWYLEQYAVWPSTYYSDRVRRIEQGLVDWGRRLYQAAIPAEHAAAIMDLWSRIDPAIQRRFSIHVEAPPRAGTTQAASDQVCEAANKLLGLPWELMHDGHAYLFEGTRPMRVRRQLSASRTSELAQVATPIRILLVAPRPEDEACTYIDHRLSALPLVDAMEHLGDLIDLTILRPVTFRALREELERADQAGTPYHVIHFDSHGTFDRRLGLGGLCFEHVRHADRLTGCIHQTIYADQLGALLHDYRVPLVFLDACQSAQAAGASESVATEVLRAGVSSVIAMSYKMLVETARRFVSAFYEALASGGRIGEAMLVGQRTLYEDRRRGHRLGFGELALKDWFVPVLYQGQVDLPLFRPAQMTGNLEDAAARLEDRLGDLPDPPATGFIGRSRELLHLERLFRLQRWALIRGQGGEGKTVLAVELARWMVRSRQVKRAAFVSVETYGNLPAVLDAIGHQLVGSAYSVARLRGPGGDLEPAIQPVERALAEQSTLIVVDNMESILLPPYLAQSTPDVLQAEQRDVVDAVLGLCKQLMAQGATRVVFTSREVLPEPFGAEDNRIELARLSDDDAVKLIERALEQEPRAGAAEQSDREAIERLVEAVHGHTRTLALLAPALRERGVEATREDLVELMAEMERRFPGDREQSVYASVELSLCRLPEALREQVRVLGVFHGGVQLGVLQAMMEWEEAEVATLAGGLIETGLASEGPYNHLDLNPALCPYLRSRLVGAELAELDDRWETAMRAYVGILVQQADQRAELTATLTMHELANLMALLERVQRVENAEAIIDLTTYYYRLMQRLDRPLLLKRVGQVSDAAAATLQGLGTSTDATGATGWTRAQFNTQALRIEQQLAAGQLGVARAHAQTLLERARTAGASAYAGADYDLAMGCRLLGRILHRGRRTDAALALLTESQLGFEAIAQGRRDIDAQRMASVCIGERGECLVALGQLDEAAAVYEEAISRDEARRDERSVAVGKSQLGTVRMYQRHYQDALAAHTDARERFGRLGEPGSVAGIWHETGMVYRQMGDADRAEDAYQRALAIEVQLGNRAEQANTLNELGNLYLGVRDRAEEAIVFHRQAADLTAALGDAAKEGIVRNNLGNTLHRLGRLDEARTEIHRAIECNAQFGHAAQPWTAWNTLSVIEQDADNPRAAAEARSNAIAVYLAYRRDDGENHNIDGRIALALRQRLAQSPDMASAEAFLAEVASDPNLPEQYKPFIKALQAITDGSRDPALADAPGLHYTSAAEILLLIERLGPGAPTSEESPPT